MPDTATKTKIYALLIGINDYRADIKLFDQEVFKTLNGCVPDVQAFGEWLGKQADFDLEAKYLLNTQATKEAIIEDGFRSHLGQAEADDILLIYFAGHGTVEVADTELWPTETDGRLECLVSYYEQADSSKFLIADKELRYLLHELWAKTQAHILAVFDSCHSGDNTRTQADAEPLIMRRSYEGVVFPKRDYQDFVFADQIDEAVIKAKAIDEALPHGQYIQFSAAASNEVALEKGHRGIFSTALLQVLKEAEVNLSYEVIFQRVQHKIRSRFGQRPDLYTPPAAKELEGLGFLKRQRGAHQDHAYAIFNANTKSYYVNRGAVHGVVKEISQVKIADLADGDLETGFSNVGLDSARLELTRRQYMRLAGKNYPVELTTSSPERFKLSLHNHSDDDTVFDLWIDHLENNSELGDILLTDQSQRPDIGLHFAAGLYYWTQVGEDWRPISRPHKTDGAYIQELHSDLLHIKHWHALYNLQSQGKDVLPQTALDIECFLEDENGNFAKVDLVNNSFDVHLFKPQNKRKCQIKIRNNYSDDLYVTAVIMTFDFAGMPNYLLDPAVVMLEMHEEKTLRDHRDRSFTLLMDDRCFWYDWPESTNRVLFVVSTERFVNSAFKLPTLPMPPIPKSGYRAGRALLMRNKFNILKWMTKAIDIQVINPYHGQLSEIAKEKMRNHPEAGMFGKRLFGEGD